jgi:nitroimidazol reductase NimA-like FMN-containing flavoprotein (pyridoxamine 5'-phosphate oxidase superfamily)
MLTLADSAVHDFLGHSMVVQVATVSPKGRPFVTPLWFVVDDGLLYVTTGAGTRAARNISAGSAVTLLFTGEHGRHGERALRVRGAATVHEGLPSWRVLLRIAAKYYVAPRAMISELTNAAKWPMRARYYAQVTGGAGHLCVRPTTAEFMRRP